MPSPVIARSASISEGLRAEAFFNVGAHVKP